MATLEDRILARLNDAVDRQIAGDFKTYSGRGLIDHDDPAAGYRSAVDRQVPPPIRLSIEEVARIAADEAQR